MVDKAHSLQYRAFVSPISLKVGCLTLQVTHLGFFISTMFGKAHPPQYRAFISPI